MVSETRKEAGLVSSPAVSRRRNLALAVVAGLVVTLSGAVTSAAPAAKPATSGNAPAAIVIDRVYSDVQAPTGLPTDAEPNVIVKKGDAFSVDVSFVDSRGRAASFDAPTTVSMTATSNDPDAALDSDPVLVAKGQRTAVLTGTFSEAVNQVRLTVSAAGLSTQANPGRQWFDVLSTYESRAPLPEQSIGGENGCVDATEAEPVCGTLLLPNGAASSEVFMSLGACDSTAYTKCGNRVRGSIVQVLADLTKANQVPNKPETDLYTKTSPATLILRCDTSLCETGAIQGIPVNFSLKGNADLGPAPACPRKGTVGQNQGVCVDYVQSKRDGASDTILYLLFTRDIRTGIG